MKIKILFLDTESTDVINMRTPYDDLGAWPYVVQLSYKVADYDTETCKLDTRKVVDSYVQYRPGEKISDEARAVNHISDEMLKTGRTAYEVMSEFLTDFKMCDAACAYNAVFDMKMLKAELLRLKDDTHMREIPWIDPMFYGTKFKKSLGLGSKWPKLSELYELLFHKPAPEGLHNSLNDVDVLMDCFLGLAGNDFFNEHHMKSIFEAHSTKPNARVGLTFK